MSSHVSNGGSFANVESSAPKEGEAEAKILCQEAN
jgi:hypothetical protein